MLLSLWYFEDFYSKLLFCYWLFLLFNPLNHINPTFNLTQTHSNSIVYLLIYYFFSFRSHYRSDHSVIFMILPCPFIKQTLSFPRIGSNETKYQLWIQLSQSWMDLVSMFWYYILLVWIKLDVRLNAFIRLKSTFFLCLLVFMTLLVSFRSYYFHYQTQFKILWQYNVNAIQWRYTC